MQVLSHSNDTISAHDAAEHMHKSGKAAAHKAMVIEAVRIEQGMTCAEIGNSTGLDHIEAQLRVSDLKNDGLIRYCGQRKCKIKGTKMSKVYLTERGSEIMYTTYHGWVR